MPKDAWTALICVGAREYECEVELRRLGVQVYLPQFKTKWRPPGSGDKPLYRRAPLFKGYVLVPAADARRRELHFVRSLRQPKWLLSSAEGVVLTIPADTIFRIARAEHEGKFDEQEPHKGTVRSGNVLSAMEMLLAVVDSETGRIMSPLLGGARVSAKADLVHA